MNVLKPIAIACGVAVLACSALLLTGAALVSIAPAMAWSLSLGFKTTQGSGKMVEVPRQIEAFERIEVKDGVRVVLNQSNDRQVTISADDNIEPLVETKVVNGTLTFRMRPNMNISTSNPIIAKLNYSTLDAVHARDGASVEFDSLQLKNMVLKVSDGASVRGRDINAVTVDITASDGANVKLNQVRTSEVQRLRVSDGANLSFESAISQSISARVTDGARMTLRGLSVTNIETTVSDGASAELVGRAQSQILTASDAGSVNARELQGETARVSAKDGASMKLGAHKTLDIDIDESASVRYAGDPQLAIRSNERLNVKKY